MKASCRNGFTLLEVLVVLVVLGLILAGLTQGMRFGMTAWSAGFRATDARAGFDTVDRTLRRLVENMDPGNDTDPAPFTASSNTLTMLTALPDPASPGTERRVEATLTIAGHRLVLRWLPYLHAERLKPPPAAAETELLPDVDRMEVSFWGPRGGWVQSWRSPDLPALVRVRLVLSGADRRRWPDIVAAPLLDRP